MTLTIIRRKPSRPKALQDPAGGQELVYTAFVAVLVPVYLQQLWADEFSVFLAMPRCC